MLSTLATLTDRGRLVPHELVCDDDRQPVRMLWLAPELEEWLSEQLFQMPKPRGQALKPYEQVEDIFDRFVGDPDYRGVGDFQNITPQHHGVYEMKTPSVRVFGWFPQRAAFVAACAEMKAKLKGGGVDKCRKLTVAFRASLQLPQPDFIRGYGNVSTLL